MRGNAVTEVARLKAQPGRALGVGGLILASSLASAGLIDEYRLYYVPIFLGWARQPSPGFRIGSVSSRWRPSPSPPARYF